MSWNSVAALFKVSPVRNGQASVYRPLQGAKHLVPSGGSRQTCVQVTGEGAGLSVDALHVELVTRHLHLSLVHLVHAKLVQQLRGRGGENHRRK